MTGSKKKAIEIGVIITGILVLVAQGFKMTMAGKKLAGRLAIEVPANFDLATAKRTLAGVGGGIEKKNYPEKHTRDIFQKPAELINLEVKNLKDELEGTKPAPEEEKLALEGIMFGASEGNVAIISGKVVREGDMLGGSKIERIEQDKVIILKNGSLRELKR